MNKKYTFEEIENYIVDRELGFIKPDENIENIIINDKKFIKLSNTHKDITNVFNNHNKYFFKKEKKALNSFKSYFDSLFLILHLKDNNNKVKWYAPAIYIALILVFVVEPVMYFNKVNQFSFTESNKIEFDDSAELSLENSTNQNIHILKESEEIKDLDFGNARKKLKSNSLDKEKDFIKNSSISDIKKSKNQNLSRTIENVKPLFSSVNKGVSDSIESTENIREIVYYKLNNIKNNMIYKENIQLEIKPLYNNILKVYLNNTAIDLNTVLDKNGLYVLKIVVYDEYENIIKTDIINFNIAKK